MSEFNKAIASGALSVSTPQTLAQMKDFSFIAQQPTYTLSPGTLAGFVATIPQPAQPKEPLAEATYSKAPATSKSVLTHVTPIKNSFHNARWDLLDLRRLATTGRSGGEALLSRVYRFLQEHLDGAELAKLFGERPQANPDGDTRYDFIFSREIKEPGSYLYGPGDPDYSDKNKDAKHNDESALFAVGKTIADDVAKMEALHSALLALRRQHQQGVEDLRARLAALEADIPGELRQLDVAEGERVKTLDDYAVAQRLLAEHWREVETAHAERRRIIENHLGLFYVKVRETPLGRTLPDPLELRPSAVDDIVPGCAGQKVTLPAALQSFIEAVHGIPAHDWAKLRSLAHLLPGRSILASLVDRRRQQLTQQLNRSMAVASSTTAELAALAQHNDVLAREVAARPFGASSLAAVQRQGLAILALDDLLVIPSPQLREPAWTLHQRLSAAAGCLLDRLHSISPSIRLGWASAAAANRLPVETPERWPGLARAEEQDFNGIRTLVELVAWCFRQLNEDASATARTTMRNLVRACLLLAASDDPQQLIQGSIKTLPSRFRPGDALRLALNREAAPGTLLQLFDASQRVIATLRVEDHDGQGTVASVASILDPRLKQEGAGAILGTALRVSGTNLG